MGLGNIHDYVMTAIAIALPGFILYLLGGMVTARWADEGKGMFSPINTEYSKYFNYKVSLKREVSNRYCDNHINYIRKRTMIKCLFTVSICAFWIVAAALIYKAEVISWSKSTVYGIGYVLTAITLIVYVLHELAADMEVAYYADMKRHVLYRVEMECVGFWLSENKSDETIVVLGVKGIEDSQINIIVSDNQFRFTTQYQDSLVGLYYFNSNNEVMLDISNEEALSKLA